MKILHQVMFQTVKVKSKLPVSDDVSKYLRKVGYNPKRVAFIPISGWLGDNIHDVSNHMPWWKVRTNAIEPWFFQFLLI